MSSLTSPPQVNAQQGIDESFVSFDYDVLSDVWVLPFPDALDVGDVLDDVLCNDTNLSNYNTPAYYALRCEYPPDELVSNHRWVTATKVNHVVKRNSRPNEVYRNHKAHPLGLPSAFFHRSISYNEKLENDCLGHRYHPGCNQRGVGWSV